METQHKIKIFEEIADVHSTGGKSIAFCIYLFEEEASFATKKYMKVIEISSSEMLMSDATVAKKRMANAMSVFEEYYIENFIHQK